MRKRYTTIYDKSTRELIASFDEEDGDVLCHNKARIRASNYPPVMKMGDDGVTRYVCDDT